MWESVKVIMIIDISKIVMIFCIMEDVKLILIVCLSFDCFKVK